jgi:lipoprotein-releasing system ATP-binding protein
MGQPTVLQTKELSKTFQEADLQVSVLKRIDFEIKKGEMVAIVGSSGSGKSTLLHLLAGLEAASSGRVFWGEADIYALNERQRSRLRNRHLGFVYQFHHLLAELSALENVAMPLRIRGMSVSQAFAAAHDLLISVGLEKRQQHRPAELSGGERQRVALCRALVTKPACVLADEPTGNLDRQNSAAIFALMAELNQVLGISFVIVTHDPDLAAGLHRQYRLSDGYLTEEA